MVAKLNSTNHRTYDSSELTDTTGGTVACWIYLPASAGDTDYIKSANGRVHLHYTSSLLTLNLKTSADADVVHLTFGDPDKDEWHQFIFSGSGGSYTTYLDGSSTAATEVAAAAGTIDWSDGTYAFGNTTQVAYLADLYMHTVAQSVASEQTRNLFWTEPSKRQTNRMPTSTDTMPTGAFIATSGLRDLALTGSLVYSDVLGPTSDLNNAQGFRGEVWKKCDLCGWMFKESDLTEQVETGRLVCTTGPHDHDKPSRDHKRETARFFIY